MVVNREKKTLFAYLDGVEQQLNIANIVSISSNTDPVIGGGINGSVDDVAIFNGVLTQDDVDTIMTKGLSDVLKANAVSSFDKTASMWGAIKSME
jgi:hypothetical protein